MVASPPFNISTSTPGDNDIVSQFPANERSNRDVINQFFLTEHNVNGYHNYVTIPNQGSTPATPAAGFKRLFADVNGNLAYVDNNGIVYYIGPAPGMVAFSATGVPNGWVEANGQAVSRTGIGAALFAKVGITFGAGDGSTTFNVPNLNGRVPAGRDNGDGTLTSAGLGTAAIISARGGAQTYSLLTSDIPAGVPSSAANSISVQSTVSTIGLFNGGLGGITASAGSSFLAGIGTSGSATSVTSVNASQAIAVQSTNAGQTIIKLVQPTIVLVAIIKL